MAPPVAAGPPSQATSASSAMKSAGSEVGVPSWRTSHSCGTSWPSRCAALIFPVATTVVLMSRTNGAPSVTGTAALSGLVPSIRTVPPSGGATPWAPQFVIARPISPAAAAFCV